MTAAPAGALLGTFALAVLLLAGAVPGAAAMGVTAALAGVVAYADLLSLLGRPAPASALAGGGALTVAMMLAASGRGGDLPWVLGALVVAVLGGRVVAVEIGRGHIEGAIEDAAITLSAVAVVALLLGQVVAVRLVPGAGFEGVMLLLSLVVASEVGVRFGRLVVGRRRRDRTAGRVSGLTFAVLCGAGTGAGLGAVLDAPIGAWAGALLGAAVGVLVPFGALAAAVLRARVRSTAAGRFPVFSSAAGLLLAAPAFHWAYGAFVA